MKIFRILSLIASISITSICFGQGSPEVEMADVLRQDGKIYSVVFGLVVILTAMIILLLRVDRKLFRMEQEQEQKDRKN